MADRARSRLRRFAERAAQRRAEPGTRVASHVVDGATIRAAVAEAAGLRVSGSPTRAGSSITAPTAVGPRPGRAESRRQAEQRRRPSARTLPPTRNEPGGRGQGGR